MTVSKKWIVFKFGGTSMGSGEKIASVANIVLNRPHRSEFKSAVVVSAMGGVTDQLIHLTHLAVQRSKDLATRIDELRLKHLEAATSLLSPDLVEEFIEKFDRDLLALSKVLDAMFVVRECSERLKDFVSGLGEVWSASLLNLVMRQKKIESKYIDARTVLTIEATSQGPVIQWAESRSRMDDAISELDEMLVITGFICRTPLDVPATLGRNGSDYSASIFGHLLDAQCIEIWTDVNGVMSADPRIVRDAVVIPELSYREAIELANFGAKVLHPATMLPAVMKNIPILIKNTFHPDADGSRIDANSGENSPFTVKGCATINDVAILYIEAAGISISEWVLGRLLSLFSENRIQVLMGTFGSPGNTISMALPQMQAEHALRLTKKSFSNEISSGQIQSVELYQDQAILAIVSDTMAQKTGIAAQYFDSLAKAGISARVINQGFSERNISVVVSKAEITKALRSTHSGFYLSPQTISLGLIGRGSIGSMFLNDLAKIERKIEVEASLDIRLRGVLDSTSMFLEDKEIDLKSFEDTFQSKSQKSDLKAFVNHLKSGNLPHLAIIDCSGSREIASHYSQWLSEGIHIISPNIHANSGALAYYRTLQDLTRSTRRHFLFESSVCASLPVIETLADLIQTGDDIIQFSGIISGSLSYIFGKLNRGGKFSDAISDVIRLRLSDGSLYEDLQGISIMRKSMVLAREMGLEVEEGKIVAEGIMNFTKKPTIEEILDSAKELDEPMRSKIESAKSRGNTINYVTKIDRVEGVKVGLCESPIDHYFSRISPGENILAIYTKRLGSAPLIIQGPGAGRELVSAGLTSDLLRLTRYLGSIG
jgi:aspartokinase/homoserine dehydrogenase 1